MRLLYIEMLDEHWCDQMAECVKDKPLAATPEDSIRKLQELHQQFRNHLAALSEPELASALGRAQAHEDRSRPFNAFGSEADFEHFGKASYLTTDEAAALSFGKDPRIVTTPSVLAFFGRSVFAFRYAARLDLIDRAVAFGRLGAKFTPLDFLTWAHEVKIEVPEGFIRHTFVRGEPIYYWHDQCHDLTSRLAGVKAQLTAALARVTKLEAEVAAQVQISFDQWVEKEARLAALKSEAANRDKSMKVELRKSKDEIAALRTQVDELKAASSAADAQASTPKSQELGGIRRKYNMVAKLLYGLCNRHYGIIFAGPNAPNIEKVRTDLATVGIPVDDKTLRDHLRAGSEQASNQN